MPRGIPLREGAALPCGSVEIGWIRGDEREALRREQLLPQIAADRQKAAAERVLRDRFLPKRRGCGADLRRRDAAGETLRDPANGDNSAAGAEIAGQLPGFRRRKIREIQGILAEAVGVGNGQPDSENIFKTALRRNRLPYP